MKILKTNKLGVFYMKFFSHASYDTTATGKQPKLNDFTL